MIFLKYNLHLYGTIRDWRFPKLCRAIRFEDQTAQTVTLPFVTERNGTYDTFLRFGKNIINGSYNIVPKTLFFRFSKKFRK